MAIAPIIAVAALLIWGFGSIIADSSAQSQSSKDCSASASPAAHPPPVILVAGIAI